MWLDEMRGLGIMQKQEGKVGGRALERQRKGERRERWGEGEKRERRKRNVESEKCKRTTEEQNAKIKQINEVNANFNSITMVTVMIVES